MADHLGVDAHPYQPIHVQLDDVIAVWVVRNWDCLVQCFFQQESRGGGAIVRGCPPFPPLKKKTWQVCTLVPI